MNQLERLQRMRLGQPVPSLIQVNMSSNHAPATNTVVTGYRLPRRLSNRFSISCDTVLYSYAHRRKAQRTARGKEP
jgi:hypothetical protein